MLFGNLVVRLPALFLADQKPASLLQPQVSGGHVTRDFARLGQFPDLVPAFKKSFAPSCCRWGWTSVLRHPAACARATKEVSLGRFCLCCHPLPPSFKYIGMLRLVNQSFSKARGRRTCLKLSARVLRRVLLLAWLNDEFVPTSDANWTSTCA